MEEYKDSVEPLVNINITKFTNMGNNNNKSIMKNNLFKIKKEFIVDDSTKKNNPKDRSLNGKIVKRKSEQNLLFNHSPLKQSGKKKDKYSSSIYNSSISKNEKNEKYDKEFLDKVKLGRENLTKIKSGLFTKDYEVIGELGTGSYDSIKKVRQKKLLISKKNHFFVF